MRPGRLPEDHPAEQAARAKLRALTPEAIQAKAKEQDQQQSVVPQRKVPKRWV